MWSPIFGRYLIAITGDNRPFIASTVIAVISDAGEVLTVPHCLATATARHPVVVTRAYRHYDATAQAHRLSAHYHYRVDSQTVNQHSHVQVCPPFDTSRAGS